MSNEMNYIQIGLNHTAGNRGMIEEILADLRDTGKYKIERTAYLVNIIKIEGGSAHANRNIESNRTDYGKNRKK